MYPYGWMMGYGPEGYGGFGFIFPLVMAALVVAAIVAFLVFLFRGGRPRYRLHGHGALEILEERFARGEISADDFRKMREDLARR